MGVGPWGAAWDLPSPRLSLAGEQVTYGPRTRRGDVAAAPTQNETITWDALSFEKF